VRTIRRTEGRVLGHAELDRFRVAFLGVDAGRLAAPDPRRRDEVSREVAGRERTARSIAEGDETGRAPREDREHAEHDARTTRRSASFRARHGVNHIGARGAIGQS
jgi:hypothetical protein